jgi:virginiamycin B lyase
MRRIQHLFAAAMMCAVALCCVRAQAAASSKVTITEFATPTNFSLPQGVDVDSNSNVWYSETSAGKIAVLRANLTTSEFTVPNGGQPFILKAASDGIWFTDSANHAIGYLNPNTGKIKEFAIPSGASPLFIQLAPDGSKWFSVTAGIGRLSPNGVITEWDVALEHPDDNIEQLSLDPSGNVWFAERNFDGAGAAGTNKVRRLNPNTNVISTYLVPTLGGNPAGVLANANGTVWVSEYFANAFALLNPVTAPHSNAVVAPNTHTAGNQTAPAPRTNAGRTPGTNTKVVPSIHSVRPIVTPGWVEYPIPTADAMAEDMRVDRHGTLWFEEDSGLLGQLDSYHAIFTEYTVPSVNSGYYNIVLDPAEDQLWFTEAGLFAPVTTKVGTLSTGN